MPNHFREPNHTDILFNSAQGRLIGTLRIKPNAVAWKPANAQRFQAVNLSQFTTWILSSESGSRPLLQ